MIDYELSKGKSKQQVCREYDSSNLDMPRKTVLTSYNNRSYQIDGLTFDITPHNHTFKWKNNDGQDVRTNMVEYF